MRRTIGLTVLITILFVTGTAFVQTYSKKDSIKNGKEVYTTFCQNCHMEDGKGQAGVFPPLAKADYLAKPTKTLIDNILNGQTGEIVVNGKKYNGQMLPYNYLTDEQIADVINYMKNTWGNQSATVVTPAMVKKIRP
jgi:mono/diheme cytochrome c family protein